MTEFLVGYLGLGCAFATLGLIGRRLRGGPLPDIIVVLILVILYPVIIAFLVKEWRNGR